jgi:hypothetical protein
MTKKDKVLAYMQAGNHITQRIAAERFNAWRLADIVYKLKREGYPIKAIERKQDGIRYAEYMLMTGETERCASCGAVYDIAEITERDFERDGDIVEHWHYCPCCGEIIDDPFTEYEEAPEEEGDSIEDMNADIWREYTNTEVAALNRRR